MNDKEIILRVLTNNKTQRKRKYSTTTYNLLGMKITVSKLMSKKIDKLIAQNKIIILSNLIDNYSESILTNFKGRYK
jgi:dihydroxyacetone kinase